MSDVLKTASPTAEALAPNATPCQTLPSSRTRRASFSAQGGLEAAARASVVLLFPWGEATGRDLRPRRAGAAERREDAEEEVEAAADAEAAGAAAAFALLAAAGLGATAAADATLSVLRACMALGSSSQVSRRQTARREWESEREFARGGGCVERASKDGKKRKNSSSRRRHSATRRNSLSEPKKRNFIPLRKRRTVEL